MESGVILDPRPCTRCGGDVAIRAGVSQCRSCRQRYLRPQPGPQEDFLACEADILLFGGGAGAGKTWALLLDAACYAGVDGWVGGIFRHNHKDLKGGAGVFAKARKMFGNASESAPTRSRQPTDPAAKIRFRESSPMDLRWPSGAVLEFRHLDEENYLDYQGLEFAWIGLEEATHYEWHWVRYLLTRLRTDTGVKTLVRMTCNPDKHHWLREWVDWYLLPDGYPDRSKSGVLRYFATKAGADDIVWGSTREECAEKAGRELIEVQSFSYIPSLFDDNEILKAMNPSYVARLATSAVEEEQLRRGNWNATAERGGMLRRERWGGAEGLLRKPLAQIVKWVRPWDKGGTKGDATPPPDYTAGVLMGIDIHGRIYVAHLAACREEPPEVLDLQRLTAIADGRKVIQCAKISPGDQGKSDFITSRNILRLGGGRVVSVREIVNKVVRVQPLADAARLGMNGNAPAEKYDPKTWQPRVWILNPDEQTARELGLPHIANWFDASYVDAGKGSPPTLGDLFWSQVDPFFDPKKKKDIPDAMGDGFSKLTEREPPTEQQSARSRWSAMLD